MPAERPSYEILYEQAKKEIRVTDHLLYVTYNLVKEIKFIISITEHTIKALHLALEALLEHERQYKRLDAFPRQPVMMIEIYHNKVEPRLELDSKYYRLLQKMLELQHYLKHSNMRFRRKDKYVLATENYETKVLDIETIKRYHRIAQEFIDKIGGIISSS